MPAKMQNKFLIEVDTNIFILIMGYQMLTISIRATWHPSVPAPKRRHLAADKALRFSEGNARHLISFKFKSAAAIANL